MPFKFNPLKPPTVISLTERSGVTALANNATDSDIPATIRRAIPIQKRVRWQDEISDDIAFILKDISMCLNNIPLGLLRYQDLSRWTFDNPFRAERTQSQLCFKQEDLSKEDRHNRIMDWLDEMYPSVQKMSPQPDQKELGIPIQGIQAASPEGTCDKWFYTEVDINHWIAEGIQNSHPRGSFVKEGGDWRCVSAGAAVEFDKGL